MKLNTYQAYTMAEVLQQIRKDLGSNAVVVHSRTFKRSGLLRWFKRTVYEVTVTTRPDWPATASARPARSVAPPRSMRSVKPEVATASKVEMLLEELSRFRSLRAGDIRSSPSEDRSQASETPLRKPVPPANVTEPALIVPCASEARVIKSTPSGSDRVSNTGVEAVARRYVIRRPDEQTLTHPAAPAACRPDGANGTHPETSRSVSPAARGASTDAARLSQELSAVRHMVTQVLLRQSGSGQAGMPGELFKYYMTLTENEVSQDIADEICGQVRDELGSDRLNDEQQVREAVLRRLTAYIPVAEESPTARSARFDSRPLTIALVGPTGVGKTTTIAKLAAAYHLRQHLKVGLITTDTYRIAAVDQLRTYANIIGIPLKVALTPTEMSAACHELRQRDVILIDTAGRSPNDREKIDEIRQFIQAAAPHETHLVLSGTAGETALVRTAERFSNVSADRIIFTKLDEAVSFGVLVNVVRRVGKQLSYITTGQDVPDHIHAGHPERLARLIVGECQPTEME